MQIVVAGLIWKSGRLLIGQRLATGSHPLLWEFPGGKVEAGESIEHALIRELEEELSIQAVAGPEFACYEFAYAGKPPICLVFFEIASYTGEPLNTGAFLHIEWEFPANFSRYRFLEGDLPLIQLLGKVHIDQVK